MKAQGNGAERFAKRPHPECLSVLIFGEDEGVVADTAKQLVESWNKETPSTVLTMDEDDVKREPALLFDALEAMSLLGDGTIIRIRTRGEKLFPVLKDVLALPPERMAAKLIVQSGALKTRSKMRTAFETATRAAALHVFADSETDLSDLVSAFLGARNVEIESEALSFFVGGLPGHRSLANSEMEKLATFAHGLGRAVSLGDIRALCESNADENARQAVIYALNGEAERAQQEMDRVVETGLSAISFIRLFELEAQRMLDAHALQGQGAPKDVGMKLKPPVWKSEWPAFQTRLRKWSVARLVRLLERLHDLERMAKSPGGAGLSEPATRALFVSLYKAASAVK